MAALFTTAQIKHLQANRTANDAGDETDFKPVVKLFFGSACTWLLTEIDADCEIAFGLCDLGHGSPELGYVSIAEISAVRNRFGGVERDRYFEAAKTLSQYASEASRAGRIVA